MLAHIKKIDLWGDSVLKGVIYDEDRKRYTRLEDNNAVRVLEDFGLDIRNNTRFGLTAPKAKDLMERALDKGMDSELAVIEFGGNDCDFNWREVSEHPDIEHKPNTPIEFFRQCIVDMVSLLRKKGIIPVLMNLPPIDAIKYFSWISKGLNPKNILAWLGDVQRIYRHHECYNISVMSLAGSLGCDLIDIRQPFLLQNNYSSFICEDGIHPNREGHALMQKTLGKYAREKLI